MRKAPDPRVSALAEIAHRMTRDMEGHPYAGRMRGEVQRLHRQAEALDNLRANRSKLDTPEAHAFKVAAAARKFDKEVTSAINRSADALREGLRDVRGRIESKVNLKQDDKFAGEIRAAFRGLSAKDRAKLVNQLVAENRGPELAAIVRAPAILTGISEDQRLAYEKMIITRHAGDEFDEGEKLQEVFGAVTAASRAASNLVKAYTDPQQLAEIERSAAQAAAASETFNQAISDAA